MRRRALTVVAVLALAACAPATTGVPLTLGDGSQALTWGDGPYGLVLVHEAGAEAATWESQAAAFAGEGMTVVAVEVSEAASVEVAISHLRDERGLERVALLAAGAGAAAALAVGPERPELVDQLILISAPGETVADLGPFPKLFVASEDEEAADDAARMAAEAPGDWNDTYLAPGAATGQAIFASDGGAATLEAIQQRLAERR